jgi:peptide/nickel transport system substrate-binding protein
MWKRSHGRASEAPPDERGGNRYVRPTATASHLDSTLLALLASGDTPIYPCHVSPRDMRQHPIGTGPFKFVEFKPNESIKLVRNPDYWKPDRPYLDGIEYTIIRNMSTAVLSFVSGKFDTTFGGLTVPLTRQITDQAPQAVCELNPTNVSRNLIINPDAAPFGNPDLRRALALSLDRKAFIDIITEGKGNVGGVMLPPPEGVWGMPPELLYALPGYSPDVTRNRKEARDILQRLGYGPAKHLAVKCRPAISRRSATRQSFCWTSSKRSMSTPSWSQWIPPSGFPRSIARTTRWR